MQAAAERLIATSRARRIASLALAGAAALASAVACGQGSARELVRVDGSSTVYPITEAVAEEFRLARPDVRVTVGISGTGGGFKKFLAGEIDVNDASRPIHESELAVAAENGISFIELPVAYDGISIVVHPDNEFATDLTVDELRAIWRPESTVALWSDVRDGWPREPIRLYGPGPDSGTFDYFTEVINGGSGRCRSDFTASEDDNMIVQGVTGDPNALGFFGFAYYKENASRVRVVPVNGGDGPVAPSAAAIQSGRYRPLSRPVFLYVNAASAEREDVHALVEFYLETAPELAAEVGYVPLPEPIYRTIRERFLTRTSGTEFVVGRSLQETYGAAN